MQCDGRLTRCLLLCLVAATTVPAASHEKSVITTLTTKWSATSLVAETSEFVGKESNASYYKYVGNVAEAAGNAKWETLTAEKRYELAIKAATPLLSSSALDLLKFSLSIRAFSPAVQLFQQVGEEYSSVTCLAFFDVHGITGCSVKELEAAVEKADKSIPVELLSVDHVLSFAVDANPLTIIVHGELGSPSWMALHASAKSAARQQKGLYVHRHFSREHTSEKVALSGYGVELAIKNTEYKAEDDSNKKDEGPQEDETDLHGFNIKLLKELHPSEKDAISSLRMHLKEIEELAPLKQWQVQNLAYQAAQKIVDANGQEEALAILKELSQNFPLHGRTLSSTQVDEKMRSEIEENQRALGEAGVETGATSLYVNGISMDVDSLDLFQLIDTLKQEEKLATGFYDMGVKTDYLPMLSQMDLTDEKSSYAVDYRLAEPIFINNLDSDKKYKQWGNSVRLMLQPYYPGMIRPIARNLFTLVAVIDPTDATSRDLVQAMYMFNKHDVPLRLGLVFSVTDDPAISGRNDAGVAAFNLFNYVRENYDVAQALQALAKVFSQQGDDFSAEGVRKFFTASYKGDYEEVFGPESEYSVGRNTGREFLAKTSIGDAPKVLLNGYMLEDSGIKSDKFEETVMMEVMRISPKIQRAIMNGKLTDKSNVGNWVLEQGDVMPRLNKRILDAPATKRYVDLTDTTTCTAKTTSDFARLSDAKKSGCIAERMRYVQRGEEDSATRPVTVWVAVDLETADGRALLYSAIKHVKHSNKARIGLLLNPSGSSSSSACKSSSISFLVHAALRTLPVEKAKLFVPKLLKEENVAKLSDGSLKLEELAVQGMDVDAFLREKKLLDCERVKTESSYARDVLGLSAGQRALIVNGLVIGPLSDGETMGDEDIGLMEKLIVARGAQTIAKNVDDVWKIQRRHGKASDAVMRASSLIGKYAAARKRVTLPLAGEKHSIVTLAAEDTTRAATSVVAVVDPLSRPAQKLASILELLRASVNCNMKLVMNPKAKLSELPLKRFYRYVGSSEVSFDAEGKVSPPRALFTHLPSKQLLTLSMHPPDAWMIEATSAKYDLDNIKMEQVETDVIALFSLEHVLLEGHCFDDASGSPPRGMQFVLGTPSAPAKYDTTVMANLGYFQLKASPGAWQLRLREGRSKEIYKVTTHMHTEGEAEEGEVIRVLIDSFSGLVIRLRVSKRPGMESEALLSDGQQEESGSIWDTLQNSLGGSAVQEKYETINVFSLASGHLYERFMRIMILSVIKNTKAPVKFWLLKNYLSPQFKESLPLMATAYGFEYELVEYKWPRWLHAQKEKHRIMWAYKILFLDVLFPLDLHKVIFVDADQVVRSDLLELMNFDLEGAPYGYTPFCDSRKEMDGFRFWKQGYWSNHLAGRRYHISALYVIDLKKFRQIAAGDRLRGQYQGLSSDPNSLSNLDQDLPNNMIHQVRIKSLPQEWLWCETWCDDGSKKGAKTIDLCNNPLTKEPKLESAMRIIPEWREYDAEIKAVIGGAAGGSKNGQEEEEKHEEL
ncbi:hypothetical protein PFISCL1PPCAC_25238 [Pristionchus fissidentatus]|uniref:UDP-glucose:glycoprotein glucosyltransferase n=1 Tax=Pristionchus fissidentatus TaxID=1538716 RepID=A0AAV5WPJ9_9BILA|nr:hypothetical protein PFISCL1PPCAC_25238 [Pristionchus fissidentatus]